MAMTQPRMRGREIERLCFFCTGSEMRAEVCVFVLIVYDQTVHAVQRQPIRLEISSLSHGIPHTDGFTLLSTHTHLSLYTCEGLPLITFFPIPSAPHFYLKLNP